MKIINLLPKDKQQELRYEGLYHNFLAALWFSIASFAVVFGVQLVTKGYLELQAQSMTSDIARLTVEVNKQDNTGIKAKINAVNDVVGDFKSIVDNDPKWSQLLQAFTPLVPQNVHVTNFAVDSATDRIDINGFAPTRGLVIQLHDNIAADTNQFVNIDYPLENVSKETNVSFHYTFFVKPEVLQ